MKIADVKVGQEVGVIRGRKADYRELPRRAEVIEIVVREEKQWSQFTSEQKIVKRKAVKVRLLDPPLEVRDDWYATIHHRPAGSEWVIEAAQIVAVWTELKSGVAEEIAKRTEKRDGQEALDARLIALFGKKDAERYARGRYEGRGYEPEIEFYGPLVERVLQALEEAAAS